MDTSLGGRWTIGILLIILASAAGPRLFRLDRVPPGLHVDEAANAWNAYTLLRTGKDQHGVSWPVFYTRAFGENRSVSYIYALLPFQALGGMNVWTTRLPAAAAGLGAILLIYFVGARLFGRLTGLAAAGILAFNPWHLLVSRMGLEAALTPLLVLGSVAALLWSHMPLDDAEPRRPRPAAAALAGGVAGISCYGYWAVRLFLPVFFLAAPLVAGRAWLGRLKTREGALALGAMVVAGAVSFGPLFWKHLADPEAGRRARIQGWVWSESDTTVERIEKVLGRYPAHFGADFLFLRGDGDPGHAPPSGTGLFQWYDLPLMIAGLAICLRRAKSSRAARLLLLWVVLYPAADLLNEHPTMHYLRSLPGLPALVLLAAVGSAGVGTWLWQRRQATLAICCGALILILIFNVRFFREYFSDDFYRQRYLSGAYGPGILQAASWIQPHLKEADAVVVQQAWIAHPYVFTLVGLGYDPEQWFRDRREIVRGPLADGTYPYEDVYLSYGKIHFMFADSSVPALRNLAQNGRRDRVFFIVMPGDMGLDKQSRPVHEIRDAKGRTLVEIYELDL